jgi:hypothetical protein
MDRSLARRFLIAASKTNIESPSFELNRRYPILEAYKNVLLSTTFITRSLQAEDQSTTFLVLRPPYSTVFKKRDITDINSKSGHYKLVYKKKICCDNCHYFAIET